MTSPPFLINSSEILNSQPVKPAHYQLSEDFETKDVINAFLKKLVKEHPVEAENLLYEWMNSVKYILRAPFKGSKLSDLKKAQYCISLLIEREEKIKDEVKILMGKINEVNHEMKLKPTQLDLFIDQFQHNPQRIRTPEQLEETRSVLFR